MTRHGLFAQTAALQRCRPKERFALYEKRKDLSCENPIQVTAKSTEPTLLSCLLTWLSPPFAAVRNHLKPALKNKTP